MESQSLRVAQARIRSEIRRSKRSDKMADSPIYRVAFRRRREGKTDYRARLALLKSGETRLVVRPTLKSVIVQFISYNEQGDNVVASATAKELAKFGWKGAASNIPAAYLAGLLAAKRASGTGVKEAVFDIGMHRPQAGGVLFAVLKGAVDGGIKVPHDKEMLPEDARTRGEHIKSMDKGMFDAVKNAVLLVRTDNKLGQAPVPMKEGMGTSGSHLLSEHTKNTGTREE